LTTLSIPLADLVLDPESNPGFSGLTDAALAAELRPYYTFLGPDARTTVEDDTLTITMPDVSSHQEDRARRSYQRAVKFAERGNYHRAIPAFEEALNSVPLYAGARRNLAMAYLESGDTATAYRLLVETLRLDPNDTWAYLLLGNISMRQDHNTERAERLYEKAVALSPDDHIVLTNYAALLAERGETEKADTCFLRAIRIEPSYPSSYYALAKMAQDIGDARRAVNVLHNMFDVATGPAVRNRIFYAQARRLYLGANIDAAEAAYDELIALVEERAQELEALSGYPTRLEIDESLEVAVITQIAWKYGRDHHLLRYSAQDKAVTPHLLLHELEHIAMEAEARQAGRNLTFTADTAAEQLAMETVRDHTRKLLREGLSETYVDRWTRQTIRAVRSRLYDIPLDMIIELRLMDHYEALRPSQFASLYKLQRDAVPILTDEHVRERTAPIIYRATAGLHYAFALCIDSLYGHRTDYAAPYKREGAPAAGSRIFTLWQRATRTFEPGDEYRLVDNIADLLKLQGWYTWQDDPGDLSVDEPDPDRLQGTTD